MGSSSDYWRTPRRGVIQNGKYRQYPREHEGPWRGESDEEFAERLAAFDAGPYEPPRFVSPAAKARYRVKARSSKQMEAI